MGSATIYDFDVRYILLNTTYTYDGFFNNYYVWIDKCSLLYKLGNKYNVKISVPLRPFKKLECSGDFLLLIAKFPKFTPLGACEGLPKLAIKFSFLEYYKNKFTYKPDLYFQHQLQQL